MTVRTSECRHGTFAYWQNDVYIGRSLASYGEYSEGEVDLFRQLLKPGHVVVEVGANIGAHTVPIAKLVGDAGRVHAFEPQRVVFQMLCANLALNGILNCYAHQAAVGDQTGMIGVPPVDYRREGNFGGVSMVAKSPEMVPLLWLDDYLGGQLFAHFLKIDVEGMELQVLRGAEELIARCRPALYVENDRKEKSEALTAWLTEHGYDLWWHTPPLFSKSNWRDCSENIFGCDMVSINMLCLPSEHKIQVNGLRKVNGA